MEDFVNVQTRLQRPLAEAAEKEARQRGLTTQGLIRYLLLKTVEDAQRKEVQHA